MTAVLGINAYHSDSSACLVVDGRLVAAAEEERFRRVKHWAGVPSLAIAYCINAANLRFEDVDHIAVNSDPHANLIQKIWYVIRNRPDVALIAERLGERRRRASLYDEIAMVFPGNTF